MYFHKYSKYKPSNSLICENYIKPVDIFGVIMSKLILEQLDHPVDSKISKSLLFFQAFKVIVLFMVKQY